LAENSPDPMKSPPDPARSHRILDRSSEISLIFGVFRWFPTSFDFTQNRCPSNEKPTCET